MAASTDPTLETVLNRLNETGFAAEVWDRDWRLYGVTDEYKVMIAAGREIPDVGEGLHFLDARMEAIRESWPAGPTRESMIRWIRDHGGAMAGAVPGGKETLREGVDAAMEPVVDALSVEPMPAAIAGETEIRFGSSTIVNDTLMMPLREDGGAYAGSVVIVKPAVGAATLAMLALGDARLFERMIGLIVPGQRPGAIMFGDLESSTALARRLPSSVYFRLIRRLSVAIDEVVVDAGGIVGKHVGDGVTAFFLSEEHGSDAGAARSCIGAAREIQARTPAIAERTGLEASEVVLRFGLHWGASLYVGRLLTSGRLEATALGDEVNEGARIESSAAGGLRLASKPLIERLGADDFGALGIDPVGLSYTTLAELGGSSEKARRDAPTISVCPV